jgi:hypothetical protein
MDSKTRLERMSHIYSYTQICRSSKWHARRAAMEFIQNMIFCNLFNARPYSQRLHELVIQGLFDEQYEVRIAASVTLSGFYQCVYIQVTDEDLVGQISSLNKTRFYLPIIKEPFSCHEPD